MHLSLSIQPTPGLHIIPNIKGSCQDRWHSVLQVRTLQSRLSDSNSLTARLQRDMLLVKAKAEALEYAVSEKDAEIDLLRQRQERQETQVGSLAYPEWMLGTHMPPLPPHVPVHADIRHMLFFLVALQGITQSAVWLCHMHQPKHYFGVCFIAKKVQWKPFMHKYICSGQNCMNAAQKSSCNLLSPQVMTAPLSKYDIVRQSADCCNDNCR